MTATARVGSLLRDWRAARRVSQLGLALAADVSSRHLSFVETGRAQPSRDLVSRLAEALDIPLRERNALMVAAGYAPGYRETGLGAPDMAQARRAIELILRQQEPYPAIVMNRHWDVLLANDSVSRIFSWMYGGAPREMNIMRAVFSPCALRPYIVNWEEVAGDLIRHLHDDIASVPGDTRSSELLREILAFPDVPTEWRTRELGVAVSPLSTISYRKDDVELTFFWTITTFGLPRDVTLEEMRIECSFPVDEATDRFCRELSTG